MIPDEIKVRIGIIVILAVIAWLIKYNWFGGGKCGY